MVTLCHVLYAYRHGYPMVHPIFIDRESRCREARICEGADRNGNTFFSAFHDIVNRRAAGTAEGESGPSAFVPDTDILRPRSVDFDCLTRKPGLSPEDASGSTLTCMAMADRHPDRIPRDSERKLTAGARRETKCHGEMRARLVVDESGTDVGGLVNTFLKAAYNLSVVDAVQDDESWLRSRLMLTR